MILIIHFRTHTVVEICIHIYARLMYYKYSVMVKNQSAVPKAIKLQAISLG